MHAEGDELDEEEHVGDGDARQEAVDGRAVHLLAVENGDVEQVQDGAEDAHHETEIAVDAPVLLREVVQVAAHPVVAKTELLPESNLLIGGS